jgi:hypothetical protein
MESDSFTVQREAIIVITNAISVAQLNDITYHLAMQNNFALFKIFASGLEKNDQSLQIEILEAL